MAKANTKKIMGMVSGVFAKMTGSGVAATADHLIPDDKVNPFIKGVGALVIGGILSVAAEAKAKKPTFLSQLGDGLLSGGSFITTKAVWAKLGEDKVSGVGNTEEGYQTDYFNESVSGLGDQKADVMNPAITGIGDADFNAAPVF